MTNNFDKVEELPPTERTRQRQDDRSAATRDRLIDGAHKVLLERGHAGLRSANISAASGVSRGGLLHHYPSKEMLVAAVYERIVARMGSDTQDRIAAAGDDQVLEAIVTDAQARFFSDAYRIMLDILIASGQEAPLAASLGAMKQCQHASAQLAWANRLAAIGVDVDVAGHVASFLWYTVRGLALRGFLRQNEEHDRRTIAFALKLTRERIAS